MLRPLLALALIVAVSGCSTLEAPFRYAGMDQKTLKSTSVSSLPTDFAFDDLLSAPEKYGTERAHLLAAVDRSLAYLRSPGAAKVYRSRSQPPFSQEHVTLSLERFRTLLLETHTAIELRDVVRKEFMFFRSAGQESTPGETLFTGYCEPMFAASRVPTSEFRFPLFLRPADFPKWEKPHPTRTQLEGHRGLGGPGTLLNGAELLYLRDRFDVFFIQVQGSSKLRLPDGQLVSVAFHGATEYPFTSVASLLIRDGKMRRDQASMTRLRNYFKNNPAEFDHYLSKNNRFIFFRLLPQHMTPRGSLDTVVTSERSIATDKSVFPPGALALMQVELPKRNDSGGMTYHRVSRFALDQDTGSAMKGPGRADIFIGSGDEACDRAGVLRSKGALYYLLLRDVEAAKVERVRLQLNRGTDGRLAYQSGLPALKRSNARS